jgi:predicted AAA+ superfamily ATPase
MERFALEKLLAWDRRKSRKPLIVYGARQVGKTYLIRDIFAERYYKNCYVYINLKFEDDIRDFINGEGNYSLPTSNAGKIIEHISLRLNRQISGKTLLIFDEIQEALPLITSLKDFKENHAEVPVIASGSLFRIKIRRAKNSKEGFFFPVGATEDLYVYPLTFKEYLYNANRSLYDTLCQNYASFTPFDQGVHLLAMEQLKKFLLIGGLPEDVRIYLDTGSILESRNNLASTYGDYLNDINLYGVPRETTLRCRKLFDNIYVESNREHPDFRPSMLEKNAKVRDYSLPMELLSLASVIHLSKRTKEKITIPLREDDGSNYRIYFFDTGFLAYQSGINMADFVSGDNVSMGVFFENYLASELVANGFPLFYWKGKNDAEFEFIINDGGAIVPIDVKKGRSSLNSLEKFKSHNPLSKVVKVSANNLGYDKEKKILTIPLYALFLYLDEVKRKQSAL